LRLPAGIIGTLVFVLIAACGGLVGAGSGLALGWLVLQAFPGVAFEPAVFGGLILALPLSLWAQFRLLKVVRPRLAMLERRLSRGSVISFADVRQPFTLLLRAFSDGRCACQANHGPAGSRMRPVSLRAARVSANAPDSRKPASMVSALPRPSRSSR
jgi:hypothetical protein